MVSQSLPIVVGRITGAQARVVREKMTPSHSSPSIRTDGRTGDESASRKIRTTKSESVVKGCDMTNSLCGVGEGPPAKQCLNGNQKMEIICVRRPDASQAIGIVRGHARNEPQKRTHIALLFWMVSLVPLPGRVRACVRACVLSSHSANQLLTANSGV
jgi:hypothetical protein